MTRSSKPTAALLNAKRLDFDSRLSFERLESYVNLDRYEETEPPQVVERALGCEILITKELPLSQETIEKLPVCVRLICEAGTGVDNIDVAATMNRGVTVCRVPEYSTSSVSQLTMSFVLALSVGLHSLIRNVAVGDHQDFRRRLRSPFNEVHGKTMGIIGVGPIGRRVLALAQGHGMNVVACSLHAPEWAKRFSVNDVLAQSDFVSLHRPYRLGEPALIQAEQLTRMRRHACLINTARGKLINHSDLVTALASGVIAGAALDVQDPEPLPEGHALWTMPNVILTPHIGWKAIESRIRLVEGLADNIRAFLDGAAKNVVTLDGVTGAGP